MVYRVVDPAYLNEEPPGQIELAVYANDATSLTDWVAKHSGPPVSNDPGRYWSPPANVAAVMVNNQNGLSFDWTPDSGPPVVHATCIVLQSKYILVIDWWSSDPNYALTLSAYFQEMLNRLTQQ